MKGVWLAGLIKLQPNAIKISTTATLTTTRILFTKEDSSVPRINSSDNRHTIMMAGRLMMPPSQGPCIRLCGSWMLNSRSNWFRYGDQREATVAAPSAYSNTRSQPMTQAMNSPIVAYEYV